ncbi:hypothetical protein M8C21_003286 [Ambrosia artemisiifolia]|uniref:Uncharacterized protein n=1 Tax=Ambrosia artemisiifolia TaxID=4212 RepID=A0AAD5BT14_AMBAR|nr:hypothetical protein M8C21_003286 [Ambrosia artemisiifolia]
MWVPSALENMARSSAGRGRSQGGGRGPRGGRGSGQGNCNRGLENGGRPAPEANQLPDEPNDNEVDEPVIVVGRGPVVPAPLPTPENRTWIWVEDDEFNIHNPVSRTIGSILKAMWSGPWQGWKDVPSNHRERMFERFEQYYQWKDDQKSAIHCCWERCIKGKFPDLLLRARNKAKKLASHENIVVGNDMTRILPYKPQWISQDSWGTLVEAWNADSWKGKSSQNSENRRKAIGGRHTLGSKSFVTVRKNMEKTLKRPVKFGEFWLQTHAKKGSRPLDLLPGCSRSLENGSGAVDGVEESIQEHNVTWVDTRAGEAYSTYNDYIINKYGEDTSLHPEIDMDLWSQTAGGKKKGRLYGTGNIADPYVVLTGASSMPSTHNSYPPGRSDSDEVRILF